MQKNTRRKVRVFLHKYDSNLTIYNVASAHSIEIKPLYARVL